jgi:hypothetical protein
MSNILEKFFSCSVCSNQFVKEVVDFGLQPPANRRGAQTWLGLLYSLRHYSAF